jgi:hypothetical protein
MNMPAILTLPYIFLGLLAIATAHFLILRSSDPERLKAIETDLFGVPLGKPG